MPFSSAAEPLAVQRASRSGCCSRARSAPYPHHLRRRHCALAKAGDLFFTLAEAGDAAADAAVASPAIYGQGIAAGPLGGAASAVSSGPSSLDPIIAILFGGAILALSVVTLGGECGFS